MPKRIPIEVTEEINRLYDNGSGISPAEIARQTGVSYSSVYGLTRARQRINPETKKPFKSLTEYDYYQARQRTNPDTKEKYKSKYEYDDYQARQRVNRKKNKEFKKLIRKRLKELGQTQSIVAEQLGVTRATVSLYFQGKNIPRGENLDRLLEILNINGSKIKSLDDLAG